MARYIVVLDTPSVKKYIFEASALKDIRGASAILDGLNRGWLLDADCEESEKIYQKFIQAIPDANLCLKEFVYANGGSGLLIVEAGNEESLVKLEQQIQLFYNQQTKGAVTPLLAWQLWEQQEEDNFQVYLKKAHWQLRRKRSEQIAFSPSSPWCRFDENLKNHRAEKLFTQGGATAEESHQWISQVSYQRKQVARGNQQATGTGKRRDRQVWKELQRSKAFQNRTVIPPESLEKIAQGKSDREQLRDIAICYADGNAMGKKIKQLPNPQKYQEFSEKIDEAVRDATYESLGELFPNQGEVPFDIILLGGDDILVVLPADQAASFVIQTHYKFQEKAGKEYSLSFGIAIGNHRTPFGQMVEQAEQCLKSAKIKEEGQAAVDFHVNRGAFFPDISDYRNNEFFYDNGNRRLICRPFTIETFANYLKHAKELQSTQVPFSRLYQMAETLKESKNIGHVGWIQGVGRARTSKQRQALAKLYLCWDGEQQGEEVHYQMDWASVPWKKVTAQNQEQYLCGFHDVLELYELLKGK